MAVHETSFCFGCRIHCVTIYACSPVGRQISRIGQVERISITTRADMSDPQGVPIYQLCRTCTSCKTSSTFSV